MILGIDFGTTHSSMTVLTEGSVEPRVIPITPNDEPYDTILRTASFIPEGTERIPSRLHQAEVHHLKLTAPGRLKRAGLLLKHFKPYFGRWSLQYKEHVTEMKTHYDPLAEMMRDRQVHRTVLRNPPYSREDIVFAAAAVLSRLKDGLGELGLKPRRAHQILLGNPVGFRGFSRTRLLQACYWAGLVGSAQEAMRKIRFVYEPVAVACSAVQTGRKTERALVFDFGGGTLDLAVVRFEPQGGLLYPEEIEAVQGLPLAGHHVDWQILHYLLKHDAKVEREFERRQASTGKSATMEILEYVEALKKDLSCLDRASYPYGEGPLQLTRERLEVLLQPLLQRIEVVVQDLLASLPAAKKHIDRVITAGGSSLIPAVQRVLQRCFSSQERPPRYVLYSATDQQRGGDVEKALLGVARGLSLYGKRSDLRERTDRALFVLDEEDRFVEILPANSPYENDGERRIAHGPELKLTLPHSPETLTLAIYEQGPLGKEYLVQYVNVPYLSGRTAKIRCSLEKGCLLPFFSVDGKRIDPLEQPESALRDLLGDDESCLSFSSGSSSPKLPCLHLGVGDEIRVRPGDSSGTIVEIRHRDSWANVPEATPELGCYLLRTQRGSGRTPRFQVQARNCHVLRKGSHFQDTAQENLFTQQLRQELSADG